MLLKNQKGIQDVRICGATRQVRHNTQANYNFVINIIKKEDFGAKRIDKVKLSDGTLGHRYNIKHIYPHRT